MRIDIQDGVLISGDTEELEGLIESLTEAVEDGSSTGQMLTDEGVERVVITREDDGDA